LLMKKNSVHYQVGFAQISEKVKVLIRKYSRGIADSGMIEHVGQKAVARLESFVTHLIKSILEEITGLIFGLVIVFLYVIFALCTPYEVGGKASAVFKRYILLKSAVSAAYALCVWLLLQFLQVDLSGMFGMLTFLFNFVPEVGPFFSIVLPCPVIIFDGRHEDPTTTLVMCLIGQFALKFFLGTWWR